MPFHRSSTLLTAPLALARTATLLDVQVRVRARDHVGTAPPTIDGVASKRRHAAGRARPAGPRRARYPAYLGDHDPDRAHHEHDNKDGEHDHKHATHWRARRRRRESG